MRVMANLSVIEAHLVRVTTDDRDRRVWVAAMPRTEAVTAVLNAIPEGWSACLLSNKLRAIEIQTLNLKPGEVREIISTRSAPKPEMN